MGLFDFFSRKPPPPPVRHRIVLAPSIELARVSSFQPLPLNSANPVDAEVSRLWLAYQRSAARPDWDGFIGTLKTGNANLAERVGLIQSDLKFYQALEVFKP